MLSLGDFLDIGRHMDPMVTNGLVILALGWLWRVDRQCVLLAEQMREMLRRMNRGDAD